MCGTSFKKTLGLELAKSTVTCLALWIDSSILSLIRSFGCGTSIRSVCTPHFLDASLHITHISTIMKSLEQIIMRFRLLKCRVLHCQLCRSNPCLIVFHPVNSKLWYHFPIWIIGKSIFYPYGFDEI
jgi:hypothetical protein